MISANNVSVFFSTKKLFENVNLKFTNGNCYGIIGANGVGKSTFLKVLSGEFEPNSGEIVKEKNARISVLKQDHFQYDDKKILDTVLMGYEELYNIIEEKEKLYQKPDFSEEDGYKAAKLEEKFASLNGWEAYSEAEKLLNGLDLEEKDYQKLMQDLSGADKVKVLLAQSLFGNPDILILDEPTNHLDFYAKKWLEKFLIHFDKTVIVVSHDRHFLNNVCTHIVDIDYQEAKMYVGNYDFWRESSELARQMQLDQNQKKEEKVKQLENFIARFSANASKSAQATSRKKQLEKITLDDIKPSSRKYPYLQLNIKRDLGKDVFSCQNISKTIDGEQVLNNISFDLYGDDKVVFLSKNEASITAILDILAGESKHDSGEIKKGITVEEAYFPKDYSNYFQDDKINLVEWLAQFSGQEQGEAYLRGFLGKMLFSGEEPLKKVKLLSGGEKMRMMFSKMMLTEANTLILDQPTNHLDLESIQSVNEALTKFKGSVIFASHDFKFIETIANKIITLTPKGAIVYQGSFEEFLNDENLRQKIEEMEKEN